MAWAIPEQANDVFATGAMRHAPLPEVRLLHAKIEQLAIEKEFSVVAFD